MLWPGKASVWYQDLRRIAQYCPALGKFISIEEYFAKTDTPTQLDRYGATTNQPTFGALQVWVDQDLCTGDGICVDYCPEVFVLLEDGIAYVREAGTVMNDPGCADSPARVQLVHEAAVMSAALDCPGECIFIETVAEDPSAAGWSPGAGARR